MLTLLSSADASARVHGLLRDAGVVYVAARSFAELCAEIAHGAGAVVIAHERLQTGDDEPARLMEVIAEQPTWSDLPIIVLAPQNAAPAPQPGAELLGNAVILVEPVPALPLISTVRTALRSRRRQYELRDQFAQHRQAEAEVARLNSALGRRVNELETLLAVVPVGIAVAEDAECRHVRINEAAAQMIGVSQSTNLTTCLADGQTPPFTAQRDGKPLAPGDFPLERAVRHNAVVSDFRFELVRLDGRRLSLSSYAAPLHDDDGAVRGGVHIFVDVSAGVAAEAELRALNETLEQRIEQRTHMVELLRDIAAAANTSSSIEEAFGYALERIGRHNGWCLGHAYIPTRAPVRLLPLNAWYEMEPGQWSSFAMAVQGAPILPDQALPGRVFTLGRAAWTTDLRDELAVRSVSDEPGFAEIRSAAAFPVIVGNEVVAVMEFFSEHLQEPDRTVLDAMSSIGTQLGRVVERARATERIAESNRLIQKVSETTPALLHVYDVGDDEIVYANKQFHRYFGLNDGGVSTGPQLFRGRVKPEDLPGLTGLVERLAESAGAEPIQWEIRVRNHDDEWRTLRNWSTVFARDVEGQVQRILSVSLDVTDQLRSEERLRQTERLTAIGTLAAGMAHEINNPLASVLMTAQLLLRRTPDPDTRQMLTDLMEDAKRCARITRSVQQFARQDPGQFIKQDLNQLVRDTTQLIEHELRRRQVQLSLDLDDELPEIPVAAAELEQVLVNVITNSMNASRAGQVITIRTRHGQDQVTVTISDDGVGMPPEVRRRAFDPFYTTRGTPQDTGLGLSIAHGIITDHGGEIELRSEPGAGTTVTISLPRHRDAQSTALAESPTDAHADPDRLRRGR